MCSVVRKYGISYRDLTEMMQERGVEVDPSTIMRWLHHYAPELEKRVRAYQGYGSKSWRLYKTMSKWAGGGNTCSVPSISMMCSSTLCSQIAGHSGRTSSSGESTDSHAQLATSIHHPDKLRSYPEAIERMKRDGQLTRDTRHGSFGAVTKIDEVQVPHSSEISFGTPVNTA